MPSARNQVRTRTSEPKADPPVSRTWILSSWQDLALFVGPPLFIGPIVIWLQATLNRSSLDMLAILVAGFGALGHHLPGMIRAYGDPDLFNRFKLRFIVAPLFLLAICIPLSQNSLSGMLLILLGWGYWHGLMQVYGFLRIYDAKVGSLSPVTAWLDWLMCLFWFAAGMVFSNERLAHFLDIWYSAGGVLLPSSSVTAARMLIGIATAAVTVGFAMNYAWQWRYGQRPNPNKLLMLASAVVFWWFAMVYIHNALLGIAIFEIFHDVQYLAIVWIYNQRRVERAKGMGLLMRLLFRPNSLMVLSYVAVVSVYGFISVIANAVPDEGVRRILIGLIWASTILHFYYDGFIWKVREKETRDGLGLEGGAAPTARPVLGRELLHGLKWAPFIVLLTAMSFVELKNSSPPAPGMAHRAWPDATHIQWNESIVQLVPQHLVSHARLAAMLDNSGRTGEAKQRLRNTLQEYPNFVEGHMLLGRIHQRLGEWEEAGRCFESVIRQSPNGSDKAEAHFRLGEIRRAQGDVASAKHEFEQVLRWMPDFEPARNALAFPER